MPCQSWSCQLQTSHGRGQAILFGGRNHTTVIAAEKKVNKWLKSEKRFIVLPGFETVAGRLSNLDRARRDVISITSLV